MDNISTCHTTCIPTHLDNLCTFFFAFEKTPIHHREQFSTGSDPVHSKLQLKMLFHVGDVQRTKSKLKDEIGKWRNAAVYRDVQGFQEI